MKFLIFGAGAIGSVIGGFLAKAGHEVTLVSRHKHIKAIKRSGLTIKGIWGRNFIPAEKFSGLLTKTAPGDFDYILLTVKSYDTESAAEQMKKTLVRAPLVVSMQNGLGNIEILEKHLGKKRVAGARLIFGARALSPGRVEVTVIAQPTAVGSKHKTLDRYRENMLRKLSDALDSAGVPAEYVGDVIPYLWAKAFYNAALNPLSALLQRSYGELAENPFTKQIMNSVIDETFTVAKAMGVKLFWKNSDEYNRYFYKKLVPPTASHYASMLSDLKKGKTEINSINGAILALARKKNIPVPVNKVLTLLVKARCRQL
ncbi:MAG TPA: ketopantoate reductase family protein [bacterium]